AGSGGGAAVSLGVGGGPGEAVSGGGEPPAVDPDHVALVGFRALDPGERPALGEIGLALPAPAARRLGMRAAAALALDGVANDDGPVLVHLDVDVIDAAEMPAKQTVTAGAGLTQAERSDLLTALLASPR